MRYVLQFIKFQINGRPGTQPAATDYLCDIDYIIYMGVVALYTSFNILCKNIESKFSVKVPLLNNVQPRRDSIIYIEWYTLYSSQRSEDDDIDECRVYILKAVVFYRLNAKWHKYFTWSILVELLIEEL